MVVLIADGQKYCLISPRLASPGFIPGRSEGTAPGIAPVKKNPGSLNGAGAARRFARSEPLFSGGFQLQHILDDVDAFAEFRIKAGGVFRGVVQFCRGVFR